MSCTLYYGRMNTAASRLENAASECREYSNELNRKVAKKIGNLSKGQSQQTSSALYFIEQKQKSLESKAQQYTQLASKIRTVRQSAIDTDKSVSNYIRNEGNGFRKSNGLDYGKLDGFVQALTRFSIGYCNSTTFGRWLTDKFRRFTDAVLSLRECFDHWFFCQGGKYWIKLALSVAGCVIAAIAMIVALIAAWPIVLAALGLATTTASVWTMLTVIATAITSIIAFSDSVVAIFSNFQATRVFNSDPGWAARYGSLTTTSDYFRKTVFKTKIGNLISIVTANFIDITNFTCTVVNVANLVRNGYRFFTDANRVNSNWRNKFRIWDKNGDFSLKKMLKNWKYNFKALDNGITTNANYNQWIGATKRRFAFYNKFSKFTKASAYKGFKNSYKAIKNLVSDYEKKPSIGNKFLDKFKSKSHYSDLEDAYKKSQKIKNDVKTPYGAKPAPIVP